MQLLRRLSFTMLLLSMMTLVACGDGEGDLTGGGDETPEAITLTLEKVTEGDLSASNDITITATLLDNGSPLAGKTVTFSLEVEGAAILDPVSGRLSTDEDGKVTITVKVTDDEGSVKVIASYEGAASDVSFDSAGDGVKVVDGEPEAASIRLFASSQQLASSGAQTIELSAIAKDEDNNLLEGVTIKFIPDSGAIGAILDENGESSEKTGPDGKVSVMLSTQAEPSNRTITVKAKSGDIADSLEIEVVGSTLTLNGHSFFSFE